MALLDISAVLQDPELTDLVTVRRRLEAVDNFGRPGLTETVFPNVVAVVTSSNPNDLNRQDPDLESASRTISVITKFRMRGQVKDYLPDVVVWRGNNFVVAYIDLYPQFGNGFYQVICTSMDRNDSAMELILNGQLAFNLNTNSGNLAYVA